MTKKDYIKIADILIGLGASGIVKNSYLLDTIVSQFCDMLEDDNRFDRVKFINYIDGAK